MHADEKSVGRTEVDISKQYKGEQLRDVGCRFVEGRYAMRTAEARLAPVSEVREMKMDMWRSLKKTGASTVDK